MFLEMGFDYNIMELVFFMLALKGFMGECGLRGGYVEIVNLFLDVKVCFMKFILVKFCLLIVG